MKQYLELHPMSEKPKKSGWYYGVNAHGIQGGICPNMFYYSEINGWGEILVNATHWLQPATGVLVSEADARMIVTCLNTLRPHMGGDSTSVEIMDNLINSLNKAK
jgi:hypothetical protein